jgi:asparagine synthase (glutamine-hydrolysing)
VKTVASVPAGAWLAVVGLDDEPAAAVLGRVATGGAPGPAAAPPVLLRGPFGVLGGSREAPAWAEAPGGLVAAGRARLDDAEGLRRRLGADPAARPSHLVLAAAALERHGEAAADLLRGDFALAVWRPGRRELLALRDPLGVAPLYLRRLPRALLLASSAHLLRRLPPPLGELDEAAVADFLLFDVPLDPERTAFAGIEQLAPGQLLALGDGGERRRRYHDLAAIPPLRPPPGEAVERFREIFARAVADRLDDGAPTGVLLSGGLDASLVAATAVRRLGRPLVGLTHAYRRLVADDSATGADEVGRSLGMPVAVLDADPYTPWRDRGALLGRAEQPINEPYFAVTAALAERGAAQGCRVVLTGEGADDLCWVTPDDLLSWLLAEPFAAGRSLLAQARRERRLPRVGLRSALLGRLGLGRSGWEPRYPEWLDPGFARRLDLPGRWAAAAGEPAPRGPRAAAVAGLLHPRYEMLHRWYDVPAAATGIEIRHPFLDLRVVELLLALPPLPGCRGKALLREAARGLLPEAVRRRAKMLFPVEPLWCHFRNPDWNPAPHLDLDPWVARRVDGAEVRRRLARPDPFDVWTDSRPVSLSWWVHTLH